MIKDPVDHHPLRLDSISIEALLHLSIFGVLIFSLSALLLFPSEVPWGRLIHIIFALIVTKHDLAVQLQLESGQKQLVGVFHPTIQNISPQLFTLMTWLESSTYLQLWHPRAVPVGHALPFDKELPFRPTLQRLRGRSIRVCIRWTWWWWANRGLTPFPDQDLLHLSFQSWALKS